MMESMDMDLKIDPIEGYEDLYLNKSVTQTSQDAEDGTFQDDSAAGGFSASSTKNKKKGKSQEKESEQKGKAVQYHCDYCRKDITNVLRIKCAVCTDFDLCVECFSVGAEIRPHEKTHAYQVMDQLNFPIFEPDWGADEELLLLEAIEMYGMGNWVDCADHVGTKTKEECEKHYFSIYIDVPTFPIPDMTKHFGTTLIRERKEQNNTPKPKTERMTKDQKFTIGPSLPVQNHELAGWMPLRQEFETEWHNEAEWTLADMEWLDTDTPELKELKAKMLRLYYLRLQERYAKRKFVLENNLLDGRKVLAADKKRPKEERETLQSHYVFLQVAPKPDFDALIQNLQEECAIKRRIEELRQWRSQGIRTIADGEAYEAEKKRREAEIIPKKLRGDGNYMPPRGSRTGKDERSMKLARRAGTGALDITGLPGLELLSKREKELCSTLRLYPQQYLLVKDTLVRESNNLGFLRKASARNLIKMDVNKTSRIYDFLVEQNFIVGGDAQEGDGGHLGGEGHYAPDS